MAQERNIVKYGLIQLTDDERSSYKIQILATVVTPNRNAYYNDKSNPPKGFFGYATIFYGAYVQKIVPIEFRNQVICEWINSDIQIEALLACAIRSINQSLINFASMHIPPILLGEATPLTIELDACPITAVKFKLLDGVNLIVRCSTIDLQRCDERDAPASVSEPSEPPPYVDESQDFSPSPPYDPATKDNNDTYYPDDTQTLVGGWEIRFSQLDCSNQLTNIGPSFFPARDTETPYLTTSNPDGPSESVFSCDALYPKLYLVGGTPPRNLVGINQNINAQRGNFRIVNIKYVYR